MQKTQSNKFGSTGEAKLLLPTQKITVRYTVRSQLLGRVASAVDFSLISRFYEEISPDVETTSVSPFVLLLLPKSLSNFHEIL